MTVSALRSLALLAGLFSTTLAANSPLSLSVTDDSYSANATRLVDGATGPLPEDSWGNSANPWSDDSYPMTAVIDLGKEVELNGLRVFAGQIPNPGSASVSFEAGIDLTDFSSLARVDAPSYNRWSPVTPIDGVRARYVRVRFDTRDSRFNLAEVEFEVASVTPPAPTPPTPAPTPEASPIPGVTVSDETNSVGADRLVDKAQPFGTDESSSWSNPQPWDADSYPMSAILDLGAVYSLSSFEYFVGNHPASAALRVEYSSSSAGEDFSLLAEVSNEHRWNNWRSVALNAQAARRVRLVFTDPQSRFNISEVRLFGTEAGISDQTDLAIVADNGQNTYVSGELTTYSVTVSNDGPDAADGSRVVIELPDAVASIQWSCASEGGAVCPLSGGVEDVDSIIESLPANGSLIYTIETMINADATGPLILAASVSAPAGVVDTGPNNNAAIDTDQPETPVVIVSEGDMPRAAPPDSTVVRAFGFGRWPNDHLTSSCIDLHDRYWTRGPQAGSHLPPDHPENRAYHTWHPALTTHPDTGEICDFGHEHGTNPSLAPADVFELAGGWPAFGYAAETAGGPRHEDHVGHKITVARFRASIGNGAGSETLYDAGFECQWLSKLHQGSFSMDAFANHLHEYFLTLQCLDGRDDQGVMDGTRVGTELSIKLVYTWGAPNQFRETDCSSAAVFPVHVVRGPEGQQGGHAMQLAPTTEAPNHREFTCIDSIKWKHLETDVHQVDLWTDPVKIYTHTGHALMSLQPYYIVKNPARVIEDIEWDGGKNTARVMRTIDVCYDDDGALTKFPICRDAPDPKPADWEGWVDPRSPFNGTLRALNFKSTALYNSEGTETFCTDAYGRQVGDLPPCDVGNILQRAATFDNNWNNGRYEYNGRVGNISGSIWAEAPDGTRFESAQTGNGGYEPRGIGFEFIIDNRNPDDDNDGVPDGANIRGQN